jgi:hypothetical protein
LFTEEVPARVAHQRQQTGARAARIPVGFVLTGEHTYPRRFPWRPSGDDDEPAVGCPRHGRIPVDVDELLTCRMSQTQPANAKVNPART